MGSPIPPRPSSAIEIKARSPIQRLGPAGFGAVAALVCIALIIGGIAGRLGLAVVVIVVAAAVASAFFASSILAGFAWYSATIELPVTPLPLGSSLSVIYRRRSRRPRDVADCVVGCRVVCEERVEYRRGTDTEVERSRVYEQTYTGPGTGTPNGLEAVVQIEVPAWTGAPSFDLGRNSVEWFILTTVDGQDLPNDEQRFPISVAPVLDLAIRNEVGDT
jgi:hypothetical protein